MAREQESKRAEQELLKIRKMPENRACANCLAPGNPLLTAVVMPFRIFVCSTCKSAHQAFSHRCKSAQMSLWTMEEVLSLDDSNGGGNLVAQGRWLSGVKDSERPREGDRLERYKEFVERAYIQEQWVRGRDGRSEGQSTPGLSDGQRASKDSSRSGPGDSHDSQRKEPLQRETGVSRAVPAPRGAEQGKAAALTVNDLLGLGSDSAHPAAVAAPYACVEIIPSPPAPVVSQQLTFDPFAVEAQPAAVHASGSCTGSVTAATSAPPVDLWGLSSPANGVDASAAGSPATGAMRAATGTAAGMATVAVGCTNGLAAGHPYGGHAGAQWQGQPAPVAGMPAAPAACWPGQFGMFPQGHRAPGPLGFAGGNPYQQAPFGAAGMAMAPSWQGAACAAPCGGGAFNPFLQQTSSAGFYPAMNAGAGGAGAVLPGASAAATANSSPKAAVQLEDLQRNLQNLYAAA